MNPRPDLPQPGISEGASYMLLVCMLLGGIVLGIGLGFLLDPDPRDRVGLDEIACQAATGFAASRARDWLDGDEEIEPEIEVEP